MSSLDTQTSALSFSSRGTKLANTVPGCTTVPEGVRCQILDCAVLRRLKLQEFASMLLLFLLLGEFVKLRLCFIALGMQHPEIVRLDLFEFLLRLINAGLWQKQSDGFALPTPVFSRCAHAACQSPSSYRQSPADQFFIGFILFGGNAAIPLRHVPSADERQPKSCCAFTRRLCPGHP